MTSNMLSKFKFFVSCLPNLETVLLTEIKRLGIDAKISDCGGIELTGTILELYLLNIWLRTANRILVRLLSFYTTKLKTINDKVIAYPWDIYLHKTDKIIIKTTCKKSKIYHSDALAHVVVSAIEKRLRRKLLLIKPHERDNSTQTLYIRVFKNRCTISIDSSGKHLHERGYHTQKVKAPLRETIAAAMIYLSNWNPKEILWDPFCGSGTILIEAALIALNIAPGINRKFAFMDWKNFDINLFNSIKKIGKPLNPNPKIFGTDLSLKAIQCAIKNAQQATVKQFITLSQKDFFKTPPIASKGFIITNPPYGKRLKKENAINFYKKIKTKIDSELLDWNISLICPKKFKNIFIPKFDARITIDNGGISVIFLNKKA